MWPAHSALTADGLDLQFGTNVAGHYVKHSSKLTLLLSGQREGASVPLYSNGDTIEGILAIARPSGVLALDVKVRSSVC